MTYDWLHCISSFWTIYSPLFIKLICGYTSSILCKIDFWIFFPDSNIECIMKKLQPNHFVKNLTGTQNCYIYGTASNAYTINWLFPIMVNSCSFNDVHVFKNCTSTKLQILDITISNQLIVYELFSVAKIEHFSVPARFLMK